MHVLPVKHEKRAVAKQKPTRSVPIKTIPHKSSGYPIETEQWWDAHDVTLEQAEAAIFAEYPPEGYETRVQQFGKIVHVGSINVLVTFTTRAASCD